MIQSIFIKLFGFIVGLFKSLIFDFTREKLVGEGKKHDFLNNKFKHLVDERELLDVYRKGEKVERIDISMPKNK